AQRAGVVRYAHAVLPAGLAGLGAGVHAGNLRPADRRRISPSLGRGIEAVRSAIRGVKCVDLRSAARRLPRIRINLLDLDNTAQIELKPSAIGPGVEEEILTRIVFVLGQQTVVELFDVAAIGVALAVHDDEFELAGRIAANRAGNILEL